MQFGKFKGFYVGVSKIVKNCLQWSFSLVAYYMFNIIEVLPVNRVGCVDRVTLYQRLKIVLVAHICI